MLNLFYFRRYIRSVWRVAIYLDGVLEMSNCYEFLKAPENEISVSWPGETKSYKLSDIKSLESQLRDAVALLKVYRKALDIMATGYSGMFGTPNINPKDEAWEMCSTVVAKSLAAPIPESIRGLIE